METYQPTKRNFLPLFPRVEPRLVDHTALIAAKHCPRHYFYQIVLGQVPNNTPPYFVFGSSYHKFREVLEGEYQKLDDSQKSNEASLLGCSELAIQMARNYFVSHSDSSSSMADGKWSYLTEERLIQCCIISLKQWINEKKNGAIKVISSEQSFNVALADGSFKSGRADQIIEWNGDIWGRDFKTSSKADNFYERGTNPNDQFIGYTLGESKLTGRTVKGQLVEVLFNQKGKTPYLKSYMVAFSKWQLEQYEIECGIYNEMITLWRDRDIYPMSHVNCTYCPYHQVCDKTSENAIAYMLKTEYTHRPWDSTKVHNE